MEPKALELLPTGVKKGSKGFAIAKRRVLVGRSQACDIVIAHVDVTAIHAVIEVGETYKIYDMDSTNGTYVNGEKVLSAELKIGDTIQLGAQEYVFKEYVKEEVPPPLDMLTPKLPPRLKKSPEKEIPNAKPEILEEEYIPKVEYPLAQDPKAEFSEYIFEDAENLYPIFKYDITRPAVEVIILFRDRIFSVDYLPAKNGTFRLVGKNPGSKEIEYAYLSQSEKVDFIEIRNGEISVFPLYGYNIFSLTDQKKKTESTHPIALLEEDILRFSKGELQIYVRTTDKPPQVKPAPIFRRDKDLKKYLIIMCLFVLAFLTSMSIFNVDKEKEKEKAPERVATILYKKLTVAKTKAIAKTEDKPKDMAQKSPTQVSSEKKEEPKKVTPKVQPKKESPKSGSKTAKQEGQIKKVQPNKGPQNTKTTRVAPPKKSRTARSSRSSRNVPTKKASRTRSKGRVQTYKAVNFNSTISSMLAKGGQATAGGSKFNPDTESDLTGLDGTPNSATVKTANVSSNIGSLVGAASGKLDNAKGAEGLANKKSIYTAGLPFKTVILGGMDPDIIRQILMQHIPQFRFCYQKELDVATAQFHGIVKLDFIIGASGHVTRASVISASKGMPRSVKGCVANVLRGIKFPSPPGGGVVQVNQPFNFYPRGR